MLSCASPLRYATGGGTMLAVMAATACDAGPPSPTPRPTPPAATHRYDPSWEATQNRKRPKIKHVTVAQSAAPRVTAQPTPPIRPSADDPLRGKWTMSDAGRKMPTSGRWVARIDTSMGELACELWPDKAPLTVANFIGLARGTRPWKSPEGRWERQPAYDGTSFHRVVPNVAIQGGSRTGRADWQPGYAIPDEIWDGANHDRAGQLCMVTTTKHSGGMQLFITDGPAPQLDGSYPIFGSCGPLRLVHAIARVEATRGRPIRPVRIETIRIERRPDASRARDAAATTTP